MKGNWTYSSKENNLSTEDKTGIIVQENEAEVAKVVTAVV